MTPIRILQVVGSLRRAGMETWLVHVLRRTDHDRFAMDFLVEAETEKGLEPEVRKLGGRVITCPGFSKPWRFAYTLSRVLHYFGPYDIVHAHNNYHAGISMAVAAANGVRARIAHSHSRIHRGNRLETAYQLLMKESIRRFATERLAVSHDSAAAFFGSDWAAQRRCRLLYCGIDLGAFDVPDDGLDARAELHLPAKAVVIGHVGRFQPEKNHSFLVHVAASAMASDPSIWMLLVGDGPTRQSIETQSSELRIRDRVVFTGTRGDVPRLLRAMNVFVFPSLFEGLGLACIEAQAAGLPVLASDGLPAELNAVPGLFQPISLSCSPSTWAAAALNASKRTRVPLASHHLRGTSFDIDVSASHLLRVYAEAAHPSDLDTTAVSFPNQ